VALSQVPPISFSFRRMLPLSESRRRLQTDGRRPLGTRGLRTLDPGSPFREHSLSRTHRQHRSHPAGQVNPISLSSTFGNTKVSGWPRDYDPLKINKTHPGNPCFPHLLPPTTRCLPQNLEYTLILDFQPPIILSHNFSTLVWNPIIEFPLAK
jgi:hypothetical protein